MIRKPLSLDASFKSGQDLCRELGQIRASSALFVLFTAALLSTYVGIAGIRSQLRIAALLVTGFLILACFFIWLSSSFLLSRRLGLPLNETSRRTGFPFIAFLLLALFMPEFVYGEPSLSRAAIILLLCGTLFLLFAIVIFTHKTDWIFMWLESKSRYFVSAVVASHAVISTALLILRHYYFGSVLGEDTGYYNQILWNTLNGEFFRGTLTQARYFEPPVYTEFAVHNSPVLFLLLPIYWLFPSFYTLLILRNLFLSASGIPLYLLAKEKMNGLAGILIVMAYYLSANILHQSLNGFYPLHFAAFFLAFAFLFFSRERLLPFVVFLVLALFVREEIAFTTFLFGVYALMLKKRWPWVVAPVALSMVWWYVSTELIMERSRIAMEDLDGLFELFGSGHNEVLGQLVSDPGKVIALLLTRENLAYLYDLSKPAAMIPFLSVSSMFMMPTAIINCLIGTFMIAMRNISYHYSLVASVCLFSALVHGVARVGQCSRFFSVEKSRFQTGVAFFLIPVMIVGLADVIRYGGGSDSTLSDDFAPKPYHATLERILTIIEPGAAVAAPNVLLPQLSYRRNLYTSTRLWRYNEPDVDYIVLDANLKKLSKGDRNRGKYESSISAVRRSEKYQLIFIENGFEVYKANAPRSPQSGRHP